MKKHKKFLALLLSAILVFSLTLPVFASEQGTVTGDGDTSYVNTEVMEVILPTSDAWNFQLDPQGLLGGLRDGNSNSATMEDLAAYAGKIIAGDYAPVAINRSSYAMKLSVDVKLTGDAIATANEEATNAGTANNVNLNVIASKVKVATTTSIFDASSEVEFALTKEDTTIDFVFSAAQYDFIDDNGTFKFERRLYNPDDKDDENNDLNGNGTQLSLGGFVNVNADWSDFIETVDNNTTIPPKSTVGIAAKFVLTKATDEEIAITKVDGAYGLITGAAPSAAIGFGVLEGTTVNVDFTTQSSYSVPFNFGNGLTIKSVIRTENGTNFVEGNQYDLTSDSIIFKFTSNITRTVVVTLSDDSIHTITLDMN